MRRLLACAALFVSVSAYATPPSPESVESLMAVTKAESMVDSMYSAMEQMMVQGMKQAVQGQSLSAEQQRLLDALPAKFIAVMRDEMNWQKMKPLYIQLYQDTFEQEEVDGMLAFYASPAGQAVVNKMPVVLQKSVAISQSLMASFIPKMRAAIDEAMAEAKVRK